MVLICRSLLTQVKCVCNSRGHILRVIHVIPFPDGGGAERLVRELVVRLPEYGIDSRALYFQNPRDALLCEREQCLDLKKMRSFGAFSSFKRAIESLNEDGNHIVVHAHTTIPF